jgi:cell division protein FtsI (penicillin-binding protein 3)
VAHLLTAVVSEDGTAPLAAIPGFEVAGKTGTANKLMPVELASGAVEQRYSDRHHVASFVGFFPASNPQVEILVVIDDADARCPGGVAYGGKVAAPVFKHLGESLIPYLDIRPMIDNEAQPMFALGGGAR